MTPFKSADGPRIGRPPKKTQFYAVTFEHNTNAPLTVTGTIEASNPARSAWLAVRDARSRAKGIHWHSLVVLIDKQGPVGPASAREHSEESK